MAPSTTLLTPTLIAFRLSLLRIGLQEQYAETGVPDDRDPAIDAGRRAVAVAPSEHPDRTAALSGLGPALLAWFEEGAGDREDLEGAIDTWEVAVAASTKDAHSHAGHWYNLGRALHVRFRRDGSRVGIDAAAGASQDAAAITPGGHPDRALFLNGLANCLACRFRQSGNTGDMQDEIPNSMPAGNSDHALSLSQLGNALRERFSQAERRSDIDAAVDAAQQSVAGTPAKESAYGGRLQYLQLALGARFLQYGDTADIGAAVQAGRRSVQVTRHDDAGRPDRLAALAYVLGSRFDHGGDRGDLEAAVDAAREATEASPGRPEVVGLLSQPELGFPGSSSGGCAGHAA